MEQWESGLQNPAESWDSVLHNIIHLVKNFKYHQGQGNGHSFFRKLRASAAKTSQKKMLCQGAGTYQCLVPPHLLFI